MVYYLDYLKLVGNKITFKGIKSKFNMTMTELLTSYILLLFYYFYFYYTPKTCSFCKETKSH